MHQFEGPAHGVWWTGYLLKEDPLQRMIGKQIFFHYEHGSRAQKVALSLLKDFRGAMQTYGYSVYQMCEYKKDVLPVVFEKWLVNEYGKVLTKSPIVKAIKYCYDIYYDEDYTMDLAELLPLKLSTKNLLKTPNRLRMFSKFLKENSKKNKILQIKYGVDRMLTLMLKQFVLIPKPPFLILIKKNTKYKNYFKIFCYFKKNNVIAIK